MSLAQRLDPAPLDPALHDEADAALLLWVDRARPGGPMQGPVGLTPPSLVIRSSQAVGMERRVDLAAFGCAHRVTAVDFRPGPGCSALSLSETLAGSGGGEYQVLGAGFVDLYTIGWAARAAAVTFRP